MHLAGPIPALETELDGCGTRLPDPPMAGEIWQVPQGCRYASSARGARVRYAEMHIHSRTVAGRDIPIAPRTGLYHGFAHRGFEQLAASLVRARHTDLSRMASQTLAQSLALTLLDGALTTAVQAPLAQEDRLSVHEKALVETFIDAHLGHQLHLETLAPLVSRTVNEFLQHFRRTFGETPAQFIIGRRLRRARYLLRHTPRGISDIAYETGFSSHSHLTSVFHGRIGVTPSEFRQATNPPRYGERQPTG
jgi:AraC family transcriptional regulator